MQELAESTAALEDVHGASSVAPAHGLVFCTLRH